MIEREGKFLIDRDGVAPGIAVGIESDRLALCVEEVRRRAAPGVFGCPALGFREDNLDFLADLGWLKSVWFWDVNLTDVTALYSLSSLEYFGVHPKRPSLDFARFPRMRQLVWEYKASDAGVGDLEQLETLNLWHYKPRHRQFVGLSVPGSVSSMEINWANPKSLVGLPELPLLKRLSIARCRNLESVLELTRIAPNLEHLVVESCGRVDGTEASRLVQELPSLRHACVQGKLAGVNA